MSLEDVFEGLSVFKSVGCDTWQILVPQVGLNKWHHITIWILPWNKIFVIDAKITISGHLYGKIYFATLFSLMKCKKIARVILQNFSIINIFTG